jgi:hypothetical protein
MRANSLIRLTDMRCSALMLVVLGSVALRAQGPPTESSQPIDSQRVQAQGDSIREYHGEWESDFEASEFRDCDKAIAGKVWLAFAPGVAVKFPKDNRLHVLIPTTVYVRVRGILRGPAPRPRRIGSGYGHGNGSDYELYVTRVLEVKLQEESECERR